MNTLSVFFIIFRADSKKVTISPLMGGITNQNYRVDSGNESFVLRIGGKGTHLLGIDRGREHTCTAIAAQTRRGRGSDPFPGKRRRAGHTLYRGRSYLTHNRCTTRHTATYRIWTCIATTRDQISPAHSRHLRRAYYTTLALKYGVTFPDTLPHVFALMEQIEQAIGPTPDPRPCHNDARQ